jgi:2-polyprenyl-6-methoxyphenol hydroxylase-like FAD-dependent oxidoreductase
MMLGFLLARAGVSVIVIEKHADFLRDFRGDTVHPSTLEMMYELGLLDEFLKLPHSVVKQTADRQRPRDRRSFRASASSLQIHCADAAMGFPQFYRRSG